MTTLDRDIRDWLEEVRARFKQLIEMDDKTLLEHIRSDGRITLPAFVRKYVADSGQINRNDITMTRGP